MDELLNGIGRLATDDEALPAAALTMAGAGAWATSLLIGWVTPVALTDRLGRFAIAASTASFAVVLAGLLMVLVSVVS